MNSGGNPIDFLFRGTRLMTPLRVAGVYLGTMLTLVQLYARGIIPIPDGWR